ncbi:MAG: aminopeptidase [Promethearchaeota archaeon]
MISDFDKKLAQLAVKYAVDVQPGEKVVIRGPELAANLMRAIYVEALKAGGFPRILVELSETQELFYKHANEDQLKYIDPALIRDYETVNCLINVLADYNTCKMEEVDPEKMQMIRKEPKYREILELYNKRELAGELKWTIVPYPCEAMAQDGKMDIYTYQDFIVDALKLNSEDPAAEWRKVEIKQDKLIEILNQAKEIHVVGEDTDLTLSVADRKWINCCGHRNLPDGEIFTTPVEDAVNGHIRFTYPGIFQGKEVKNIYLEVKDGKVTKATAEKGQEILDEILTIDGADGFGEFAIGTNKGIKKFTKNILFDEKLGGCLHMALGMGFPETGGTAMSTIHWDIIKNMESSDSKIFADGKVIYEAGNWKI